MSSLRFRSARVVLLGSVLATAAFARADSAVDAEHVASLQSTVRVEGVRATPETVSGLLVNETDDQLEDVRLLIADDFLWRDEFHPGANSPAQAHSFVVAGPIPPHGRVPFTFQRPAPLESRDDGRFTTEVSAVELVRREPAPVRTTVDVERSRRYRYDDY